MLTQRVFLSLVWLVDLCIHQGCESVVLFIKDIFELCQFLAFSGFNIILLINVMECKLGCKLGRTTTNMDLGAGNKNGGT